jgi:REP element-mobilizing transposase RayT
VHVTLRAVAAVGRLRKRHAYQAARQALAKQLGRDDFRVVHVSVQHNHVHLIVEADSKQALARGMQGLCSSMSRRLNRRLERTGPVFAHRYDARAITSPRQARNCTSYVLNNWRRHREDYASTQARRAVVDPYSSGSAFDGWRDLDEPLEFPAGYEPLPTARATTWLLTVGWKRHGAIGTRERPGPWDA